MYVTSSSSKRYSTVLSAGAYQFTARTWPVTWSVTVYGADHPGIVHAAASALARRGIDITDLNSRLMDEEEDALYVLMMEVALPPGTSAEELEEGLAEVGSREGVEVTLHELERDEL